MNQQDELLSVGFFAELDYGQPDDPSFADVIGRLDPAVKEHVLAYLAGGHVIQVLYTTSSDVLDETDALIGELQILSDGTWAWPTDLSHYVELYDVALPDDFLAHMAAAGWQPPPEPEPDEEVAP